MGKKFVLQSEGRLIGEFVNRSEHDTYDEAEEAAVALFDNGSGETGDFRIVEAETGYKWRLPGHRLVTEECPICRKKVCRQYMIRTHDFHGIPFRLVCENCYDEIMNTKGYDGERYGAEDECLFDY